MCSGLEKKSFENIMQRSVSTKTNCYQILWEITLLFVFFHQPPNIRSLIWSRPLIHLCSDFWSKDDVLLLFCVLVTKCLVVIVIIIIIYFWYCLNIFTQSIISFRNCSYALTILSEIQAVHDIMYLLINHAFTSDNLSRPCVYLSKLSRFMSQPSSTRLCYQAHCLK